MNPLRGGGFRAKMRNWSVQPDSDGDSTDAYTYSGAFKANGSIITGVAKVVEGSENDTQNITMISFTADGEQATQLVTFSVKDSEGQVAGAKIAIDSTNTIYTDLTGIASVDLVKKTYSSISISKAGYTTQSNVSVAVSDSAIFKEITLVEA